MSANKILLIILLVASIFRFWGLTKSPPALNWDEVSIGINAYSVLTTARDEWGKFLPLAFKAYGEYKLPGMIYASIPGIALFGLNEIGVRLTPALIGILAVYTLYLLGKELASIRLGLIASALLSISPWHVHLSRASFEAGLALLFIELSLLFYCRIKKDPRALIKTGLFAVLSLYTYNSARIFLPLLFIWLFWRSRRLKLALVSCLLFLPLIITFVNPSAKVRWNTLDTLNNEGFLMAVGESRRYTPLPDPLPRLIHNKYTHLVYKLGLDYLQTFSSELLLFKGSAQTQRSVQGMGLLYLFEFPLLVIGLLSLKDKKYSTLAALLIPWILFSPIPSAITVDAPSSLRALNLLPALLLVEGIGFLSLNSWLSSRSRYFKLLLLVFVLWNISLFVYRLLGVYPIKYSSEWQWGYKQMIQEVNKYEGQVDKVYITNDFGEPQAYLLFYGDKKLLRDYQNQKLVDRTTDPLGWVHVLRFSKYEFVDFEGTEVAKAIVRDNPGKKILLVTGFAQLPGEYPRLFEIKAPNYLIMFEGAIIDNP
ncbi:hypothetical protein A2368_00435 [Candidatus Collierbacteria bacterium RIFOXYB1_FULL_49_13]|uniref:Glycosyltransferase RgtA/B/C/D-like domain-containing protein n=1 Tax=Candidatus Collierbacteria bacterium RIFOXYB1_FULL_49_13 TaxID=1817728 RepID=A0A1F5FH10_9BACT|nr:MAG: hypothetical protein A2368_00435 [Candidatus Collierbacteria bacterium RIFOXYB1_FULL_49_13]